MSLAEYRPSADPLVDHALHFGVPDRPGPCRRGFGRLVRLVLRRLRPVPGGTQNQDLGVTRDFVFEAVVSADLFNQFNQCDPRQRHDVRVVCLWPMVWLNPTPHFPYQYSRRLGQLPSSSGSMYRFHASVKAE